MRLISMEESIKNFLKEPEVQGYLESNNLDPLYEYFDDTPELRRELTNFLLKLNINPIEYVTNTYPQMYSNTNITKITIPETILYIKPYCFENCKNLRFVTLHEGLKALYESVFEGCTVLQEIVIPESVKYIGPDCFEGCLSLKHVTILGDHVKIDDSSLGTGNFILRCYKDSSAHQMALECDLPHELI